MVVEGLHQSYASVVGPTLDQLLADYPRCPLTRVALYEGRSGDRSIANADVPGTIQLNTYWFRDRSLEDLREEARTGYVLRDYGGWLPDLRWHGGMVEPQHVLAHEFGHVLSDAVPGYLDWATATWRAATADPERLAVSGYALQGPEEYWGEMFAALALGLTGGTPEALSQIEVIREMVK